MVTDLRYWVWLLGPWSLIKNFRSWDLGLWHWILGLAFWVADPGSWDKVSKSFVPVHSAVITKCDKKLLQNVTGITKCDIFYKVRRNSMTSFTNRCLSFQIFQWWTFYYWSNDGFALWYQPHTCYYKIIVYKNRQAIISRIFNEWIKNYVEAHSSQTIPFNKYAMKLQKGMQKL